ncbi:MAG: GNAT family N-acetyltransferase [Flavobacteriia bacterium]|nr:GNAT family N-acetyltransferase [Flavobacteriia bacterium]
MPGLLFPELDGEKGIAQVPIWPKGYKVLVANVLGRKDVKGAIVVPAEPFMVLPVRPEWETFEDYLGAMSTKYRTRAKKALKLAEGCEHVDLSDAPVHSWSAWASYLLKQTLRDKTVTLPASLEVLLKAYKENLGEAFRVFGYRKDGHWVGFITAIVDDEAVHAMHMGFEPSYAQQSQFYQRSMMDLVRLAIEERKPLLNMGRTATEIKSTMGAVPVENSFVFFSPRPVVRALLRLYARRFHCLPEYTLRSPFKA